MLNAFFTVADILFEKETARGQASPTETANRGASSGTERVELSFHSTDVQKIHEIIQQNPEVRAERIQALKEQIARGDYSFDPYKVADKMLISLKQDNIIEENLLNLFSSKPEKPA